jgi:VanZ family protein
VPFGVVALVVLVTGLSPVPVPQVFWHQDKVHHLLGFAALAFTARLAFPRVPVPWLAAAMLAGPTAIELGQGLLPLRTASAPDMLANAVGVLLGMACYWAGRRWLSA